MSDSTTDLRVTASGDAPAAAEPEKAPAAVEPPEGAPPADLSVLGAMSPLIIVKGG